jgi:hypothetical protein
VYPGLIDTEGEARCLNCGDGALSERFGATATRLPHFDTYVSSTIVTGPSLTSSTCIRARKQPVCAGTPMLRSS